MSLLTMLECPVDGAPAVRQWNWTDRSQMPGVIMIRRNTARAIKLTHVPVYTWLQKPLNQ